MKEKKEATLALFKCQARIISIKPNLACSVGFGNITHQNNLNKQINSEK